MKKALSRAGAILLALLFLPLFAIPARAADVDVMFTDPAAVVGTAVTVRAYTDREIAGVTMTLVYDAEYLTYTGFSGGLGGADVKDNGGSLSIVDYAPSGEGKLALDLHFTANTVGTTSVRPTACMVSDAGGDTMEVEYGSHSSVVTIRTASRSGNCDLSAIYIYPGTLSPAFSSGVTTYAVTVPNDTTWLAVTPEKADGEAEYAISDNSLEVGVNTITVKVTAPNGNEKVYTLKVTRQPLHPAETATPSPSPAASASPTPGAVGKNILTVAETAYEILPAEDSPITPDRCAPGNFVLDGRTFRAFLPAEPCDYVILYARRSGQSPALYLYDTREGTAQRWGLIPAETEADASPAPVPAESTAAYEGQLRSMRLKLGLFAAATALFLVTTVALGAALGRRRRK